MGCDIHAYVEYRDRTPRNEFAARWRDFGSRINPGRNYSIFERMAGVRGDEVNAVAPPRGYPEDASYAASEDNWLWIAYDSDDGDAEENSVSEETAQKYIGYGAKVRGEVKPQTVKTEWRDSEGVWQEKTETRLAAHDGKPQWVAHPDWHSHSWLTTAEFAQALSLAVYATPHEEPEYHAMLAAMRSLEASGYDARVVFWFDN